MTDRTMPDPGLFVPMIIFGVVASFFIALVPKKLLKPLLYGAATVLVVFIISILPLLPAEQTTTTYEVTSISYEDAWIFSDRYVIHYLENGVLKSKELAADDRSIIITEGQADQLTVHQAGSRSYGGQFYPTYTYSLVLTPETMKVLT